MEYIYIIGNVADHFVYFHQHFFSTREKKIVGPAFACWLYYLLVYSIAPINTINPWDCSPVLSTNYLEFV